MVTRLSSMLKRFLWILAMVLTLDEAISINMSTILDDMFRHYDRRIPPKHDKPDKQVVVEVNIHVMSMYSISETNMDFSMAMLIGQKWSDERLKFDDVLNFSRLELDDSLFDHVWTSDLYIINEHFSDYHEVMVPNKFTHIYPDGKVHLCARITGTFSCYMLLHKYPFDTQHCHIEVGSFGHRIENIKFVWTNESLTLEDDVNFPQFTLINVREYNCERKLQGSVYPCIGLEFTLVRSCSYFIIEVYVPCILIVVLSWVSFWIDCMAVPARVSLGLLTVLTMTTQSTSSKSELPRVSYVKALDVYLTACLAFVFLGLLEFAYVNVLTQAVSRKMPSSMYSVDENIQTHTKDDDNRAIQKPKSGFCCHVRSITSGFKNKSGINKARYVDNISKLMFPGTFIMFNLFYWIYYLYYT